MLDRPFYGFVNRDTLWGRFVLIDLPFCLMVAFLPSPPLLFLVVRAFDLYVFELTQNGVYVGLFSPALAHI